jgi:hypothetical protein
VQRRRPPPKIRGPPEMMEFTDDDMEEKEELSNELMTSPKAENHYFRGASRQVAPKGL